MLLQYFHFASIYVSSRISEKWTLDTENMQCVFLRRRFFYFSFVSRSNFRNFNRLTSRMASWVIYFLSFDSVTKWKSRHQFRNVIALNTMKMLIFHQFVMVDAMHTKHCFHDSISIKNTYTHTLSSAFCPMGKMNASNRSTFHHTHTLTCSYAHKHVRKK